MTNSYTLKDFIKLVEGADFIYGYVSLNAAERINARIKKRTLLERLNEVEDTGHYYYCSVQVDHKDRVIINLY